MQRYFTKFGGMIFLLVAIVHATRIFAAPRLNEFVPLWVSVILAALLLYGFVQYMLYRDRIKDISFHKVPFYLSAGLFLAAFLVHSYVVFFDNTFLSAMPLWLSYVALPLALFLSYYNVSVTVKS